ncbi:MAG: hypothetical protein EOO06_07675 [Chitinophagaceae bacterium]|nr:MAG: hypothetical protein EOO06_07675 [Chitinophagaceae bacterium]
MKKLFLFATAALMMGSIAIAGGDKGKKKKCAKGKSCCAKEAKAEKKSCCKDKADKTAKL